MKSVSVRDMRVMLTNIDEVVEREGELLVTRRGKAVARVTPVTPKRKMPSHTALRKSMPYLETSSADLIRAERDRMP